MIWQGVTRPPSISMTAAAAVTIRFWRESRPSVDRRGLCNSGPSGRETIVPPSVAKYPLLDTTVVSYRVDKLHAKWKLGKTLSWPKTDFKRINCHYVTLTNPCESWECHALPDGLRGVRWRWWILLNGIISLRVARQEGAVSRVVIIRLIMSKEAPIKTNCIVQQCPLCTKRTYKIQLLQSSMETVPLQTAY